MMTPSMPAPTLILTSITQQLDACWREACAGLDHIEYHVGTILDVACDALVSPAYSFGFMDGGIDAVYTRRFGGLGCSGQSPSDTAASCSSARP